MWIQRDGAQSAAEKLGWDKTQLTPLEVSALLDAVHSPQREQSGQIDWPDDQAARLALRCMLVFGCALEDVQKIRTMRSTELDSHASSEEGLATRVVLVDPETDQCVGFALPAIGPRYTSRPPDSFTQAAHAAQPYIRLPDVTGLGAALLQHQCTTDSTGGGPVFNESPEQLEGQIKLLLEAANHSLDTQSRPRLTTTKVARKLSSLLWRAGIDEVGVALICGDRRYERQARLHYTQHQEDDLIRAYTKAARRMLREAGCTTDPVGHSHLPVSQSMLGARLVVKNKEMYRFVQGLRNELGAMPMPTRSGRHRYHRALVLYTLVMQGLLTTTRPSNRPEQLMAEALAHHGQAGMQQLILPLVEKDDQYESRARAVVIPDRLKQQFSHLVEHTKSTWRWRPADLVIPSFTPTQHSFLDWPDDQAKPRAQVVGAQWLASQLAHFGLPAAANFTRAYVRTWLLHDGCAEQVVDAFLGHANFGQSPTSAHGTLDFAYQLQEVGSRLDRMADGLVLHPVASKLATPESGPSATFPRAA